MHAFWSMIDNLIRTGFIVPFQDNDSVPTMEPYFWQKYNIFFPFFFCLLKARRIDSIVLFICCNKCSKSTTTSSLNEVKHLNQNSGTDLRTILALISGHICSFVSLLFLFISKVQIGIWQRIREETNEPRKAKKKDHFL